MNKMYLFIILLLLSSLTACATMTPLTNAAKEGDIPAMQTVLKSGANVNEASTGKYYASPLHWAARYGQVEAVKVLLEAGADINGRDYCDQTPLIYALYAGTREGTEVAEILIAKGSDTEAVDCFGWRAINYAKRVQNAALVSLIAARSAGKRLTDIDDPDFKPDDIWVISYKQAIPQVNYKGSTKIALTVHDQRSYVVSGDKKTPDYVGSPPDVKTAEKKPLAEVLGNCIANGLREAGYEVVQATTSPKESYGTIVEMMKQKHSDKILIVTLNEWIVDNWYWTGRIEFTYDIILRVNDIEGKEIATSMLNGKDDIAGYRGVHQMLAKVFAPEAAQKRLGELLNKPEIAAVLR